MSKALLIKSDSGEKTGGVQGQWNPMDDATSYIEGIDTGKVLDDLTADKLAILISGVPTPWARAKLFKFALRAGAVNDANITKSGLDQFYESLRGEWRGLLAIIALFQDRVRFSDPIIMNTKGDRYDISAAMGRMLFDDKLFWSDPVELNKGGNVQPFIQLIYYENHLVGATSPFTGVFTGVHYDLGDDAKDINWYRNGKLEDPVRYLDQDQVQKMYLFLNNINNNIFKKKVANAPESKDGYETAINAATRKSIDIQGFKVMCSKYLEDVNQKAANEQYTLRQQGPIAKYGNLKAPFSILFESDVPVYMKPDFTFTYSKGGDCILIGDIQELLSNDNFVIGWTESADPRQKLQDAPVYYVKVKDLQANSTFYFTIPLSEKGLNIFHSILPDILDYQSGGMQRGNTRLIAHITDKGKLAVQLQVEIDGHPVSLNVREYDIQWVQEPWHVILWPNFISDKWTKYYLYTEFTEDKNVLFKPFFQVNGSLVHRNLVDEPEKKEFTLFVPKDYNNEQDKQEQTGVECSYLVKYPKGQVDSSSHAYSIFQSNTPIVGLSAETYLNGLAVHAGYLVLKINDQNVRDLTKVSPVCSNATVGFDFGSNNTCVFYTDSSLESHPVKFQNFREVLVGIEHTDMHRDADPDELLFLSNYVGPNTENGQFKSWLHEHDSRYLSDSNTSDEIAGGVPVNRPNIIVENMTRYDITTQVGILHYNMKWLDDDAGFPKKESFLKNIWLQTCAYLYQNRILPRFIHWSYPGSMMSHDYDRLGNVFEQKLVNPLKDVKIFVNADENGNYIGHSELNNQGMLKQLPLITEAEAVCNFARKNIGLVSNRLLLGIDVGGSTSDILILGKDNSDPRLFRESSVRLAAGAFFNAVTESDTFRKALVAFVNSGKTEVHVNHIDDIADGANKAKAPFYLNSIFDQLKDNEYETFYNFIATYPGAKFVFTIPAFVTGVLLYYSGMLIGKVIKDHNLNEVNGIDLAVFNKGGRLFHWLRAYPNARVATEYYTDCLNAGLHAVCDKYMDMNYRSDAEQFNKSEVARGLCDFDYNAFNDPLQEGESSDICGEVGVKLVSPDQAPKELAIDDELNGSFFGPSQLYLDFSSTANFQQFFDIFASFVSEKTALYPNVENALRDELKNLPSTIEREIQKDTEYRKAQRASGNFNYHQPIFIVEATSFLGKLIEKIFNR